MYGGVRMRGPPATVQCTYCSRSFGRQEHLTRHLRIHTRERPFTCPVCSKSFARLDVLNRHKAAHEDDGHTPGTTLGPRACLRCASDRVRCSREQPCRRCSQRGFACQFPPRPPQHSPIVEPPQTTPFDQVVTQPLSAYEDTQFNPGFGLSDINWLSPQYQDTLDLEAFLAPFALDDYNFITTPRPPFITGAGPDIGTDDAPEQSLLPLSMPVSANANAISTPSDSSHSISSGNRYYVDGTGARAPFGGQCQGASECTQREALIQDALCPISAYGAMVQAIKTESLQCAIELHVTSIPSLENVQLFVRKYFENFHPTWPFLRRSSFAEDASSSWVLLLAVAVVGSRFCSPVQDALSTSVLARLLSTVLTRRSYGLVHDSTLVDEDLDYDCRRISTSINDSSFQILRAGVLNVAYMLYSGKQALVERALVERQFLVEACRKFGLIVRIATSGTQRESDSDTSETFEKWLLAEGQVRLTAMTWTIDTLVVYEFHAAPAVPLDTVMSLNLPILEDKWECSSGPSPGTFSRSHITFGEALEMLYVEKRLPPELGDFSTGLLIMAIYRNTVDILARDRVRLNAWTPSAFPESRVEIQVLRQEWLPTTRIAMDWRNSACDCLDILHWPANSKIAHRTGIEHHTVLQLHLARLIILTPTNHIQTLAKGFAATGNLGPGQTDGQLYSTARLQVLQWVLQDHCKARLSLVHCGALFWHVRRYSCDSLLEPYAIYIATLVLWAFCVSMQVPDVVQAVASESDEVPEPSFLHLDRPLDDELVQTYVRLGFKMSAHMASVGCIQEVDAPKKIVREGLRLLTKKPQSAMDVQMLTTDELIQAQCTWGIERTYRRVLASLLLKE